MEQKWSGTATVDGHQNVPVRIMQRGGQDDLVIEAARDGDSSYSQISTPIEASTFNTQPSHDVIQRLSTLGLVTRTQTQSAGATGSGALGGTESGKIYTGSGMGINPRGT